MGKGRGLGWPRMFRGSATGGLSSSPSRSSSASRKTNATPRRSYEVPGGHEGAQGDATAEGKEWPRRSWQQGAWEGHGRKSRTTRTSDRQWRNGNAAWKVRRMHAHPRLLTPERERGRRCRARRSPEAATHEKARVHASGGFLARARPRQSKQEGRNKAVVPATGQHATGQCGGASPQQAAQQVHGANACI
eukprot:360666-Chlamydomonas_euryale.AAC.2